MNHLPSHWLHDPTLKNDRGETLAMSATRYHNLKYLPDHWLHDPTLSNNHGYTVAMIYATCN